MLYILNKANKLYIFKLRLLQWILISILVTYSCYRACESQIKNAYYNKAADLYDEIKNINALNIYIIQ